MAAGRVLVVWDFDSTLVDVNSEAWVYQRLAPHLLTQVSAARTTGGWNSLMDQFKALGVTQASLDATLGATPADPSMLRAVRTAHARGAEQRILSDANSYFISTVLTHHDLAPLFTTIVTNPCRWEDGRLQAAAYVSPTESHGCPLCPPHLCKGAVLDRWLGERAFDTVVYVGDGSGDLCPATRLRQCDVICCRAGYRCHQRILREPRRVRARVVPWATGDDVEALLRHLLSP